MYCARRNRISQNRITELIHKLSLNPNWHLSAHIRTKRAPLRPAAFNIKHSTTKTFSPELNDALESYQFPGNVRELAYLVERLIILSPGNVIEKQYFSDNTLPVKSDAILSLKEALAQTERELLLKAIRQYKTTRAMGKILGVSHVTIAQKLKQYGMAQKDD